MSVYLSGKFPSRASLTVFLCQSWVLYALASTDSKALALKRLSWFMHPVQIPPSLQRPENYSFTALFSLRVDKRGMFILRQTIPLKSYLKEIV